MATRSSSVPLLFFGFNLLIQHFTLLRADLPKVGHHGADGKNGDSIFITNAGSNVIVGGTSGRPGYGVTDWNIGNLKMRAFTVGSNRMNMMNNQVRLGNKVIVADTGRAAGTPAYQKTSDGSRFYTNAKVSDVPMTKAEINQFEADWAQHKKEAAERQRQRAERQRERADRKREKQRKRAERQRERQSRSSRG